MRLRTIPAAALLISLAAAPRPAWAEEGKPTSAADKALAEAFFRDAKKLMAEKKISEACSKFAQSYELDPTLGSLLNLAVCHEEEGKTASAWAEFTEAASKATALKRDERAEFAKTRAADLERRLSKLVIAVAQPPRDMKVSLNGRALSSVALGSEIPVDPGPLEIEVTAPGKKPRKEKITVEPGPSKRQVSLPTLEDEVKAPPPPVAAKEQGSGGSLGGQRIAALAVGGVGLAGIAVGAVFGVQTLGKAKEVQEACGDKPICSRDVVEKNDEAYTSATISTVAFGVGAAAVAAGITLWLTAPPGAPSGKAGALHLLPVAGPSEGGVIIGGRF
ncbi:hypothetical protein [Polyangium aurulentum]|uniref:hypothetical protein n=1 Tax=Polyangium aurulentum TaxID=2567896 RepID=UPI0010ADBDD7|nr:hypothetical protein [Polyangium aurulentum]UQA58499.1 hypothetical protein E8A73_045890 [Polyangium aurulentum]